LAEIQSTNYKNRFKNKLKICTTAHFLIILIVNLSGVYADSLIKERIEIIVFFHFLSYGKETKNFNPPLPNLDTIVEFKLSILVIFFSFLAIVSKTKAEVELIFSLKRTKLFFINY